MEWIKLLMELFGIITGKKADKKLKYIRFTKRMYRKLRSEYKKDGFTDEEKVELKELRDKINKDVLEL